MSTSTTTCAICRRDDVSAIDALLAERAAGIEGLSYASIARRFSLVKSSLQRHDAHRLHTTLDEALALEDGNAAAAPPQATPHVTPQAMLDAPSVAPAVAETPEPITTPPAPSSPAQARWARAKARQARLQEELDAALAHAEQIRADQEQRRAVRAQAERAVRTAEGSRAEAETALRAASAAQLIADEPGTPAEERQAAAAAVKAAEARLEAASARLVTALAHRDELAEEERSSPEAQAAADEMSRAEADAARLGQQLADLAPAVEEAWRAAGDERVEELRLQHRDAVIAPYAAAVAAVRAALTHAALWYAAVAAELEPWPALAAAVEAVPYGDDASQPLGALPRDAVARAGVLGGGEGWPVPLTAERMLADAFDLVADALEQSAGRGIRAQTTGERHARETGPHQISVELVLRVLADEERLHAVLGIGGQHNLNVLAGLRHLVFLLRDVLGDRPEPSRQPVRTQRPVSPEERARTLRQVERIEREHAEEQRREQVRKALEWRRQQVQ